MLNDCNVLKYVTTLHNDVNKENTKLNITGK